MEKKFFILALILLGTPSLARDIRPRNTITPIGKTSVTKSSNKTDVINIVKSDKSGISHNKFTDFNIEQNLILNNSTKTGESQLGGTVQGNKNLAGTRGAITIVTEVMGGNLSNINAGVEVFGRKSDLIIANQNGINVNGTNFINTKKVTLTTGKIQPANPNRVSSTVNLDVEKGNITVGKKGMKSHSGDLTLISKTANIDGNIDVRNGDVNIITGSNRVGIQRYDDPTIVSLQKTSGEVAISGSSLGSMYGNRITLHSSDKGAKIKLDGKVTGTRNLAINAKGDVLFSNELKSNNIDLKGEKLAVDGKLKAKNIGISGVDVFLNNAPVGEHISINSLNKLENNVVLKGKTLNLNGKDIVNKNIISASGEIDITADKKLLNKGKIEGKNVNVQGLNVEILNDGNILAKENIHLIGGDITNNNKIKADSITISGENIINNGSILTKDGIRIHGESVVNNKNMVTSGNSTRVDISAFKEFSNGGKIQSDSILVEGYNTKIINNGDILAKDRVELNGKTITNNKNIIVSDNSSNINVSVGENFSNKGKIQGGELSIHSNYESNSNISNDGNILVQNDIQLNGGKFVNSGNISTESGNISVRTENDFLNDGDILAKENIEINSSSVVNNKNIVASDESAQIEIFAEQGFSNKGKIQGGDVSVAGYSSDILNDGNISAEESVRLNSTNVINNGNISAKKNIRLNSTNIVNNGDISAKERIQLTGDSIVNNKNIVASGESAYIKISAHEKFLNDGKIKSDSISIDEYDTKIVNNGDILTENDIQLTGQNLSNSGNISSKSGNISISVGNEFLNDGDVLAKEGIQIVGDSLVNNKNIVSSGDSAKINITVHKDFSNKGKIQGDNISIEASNSDVLNDGDILAKENLKIHGDNIVNNKNIIVSGDSGKLEFSAQQNFINKGTIKTDNLYAYAVENFENDGEFVVDNKGTVMAEEIIKKKDFTGTGHVKEIITKW